MEIYVLLEIIYVIAANCKLTQRATFIQRQNDFLARSRDELCAVLQCGGQMCPGRLEKGPSGKAS
jgi:hypothetical protein